MVDGQRRTGLAVVAGLVALLLTAPRPAAALASLADAGAATDPTGPLVAAVALLAWTVAGWLALTVCVVLLARLPGQLGRAGAGLARRVAPGALRRAVEAALGLTVAVSALGPTATFAAPVAGPAAVVREATWDLDWPSRSAAGADDVRPTRAAVPVASAPPAQPAPAPLPSRPPSAVRPPAPTAAVVVVSTGDSLWSIAEASLRRAGTAAPTDRQVASAWPRWWAANRAAIGDDPDLLLPGTVLRAPVDRP